MTMKNGVVEHIGRGGFGSEAEIQLELRTEFPGIGGTLLTHEGVATAVREEYNRTPKAGHRLFLVHAVIKKLEDYFYRKGIYKFAHIPRPLGSVSTGNENPYESYLYEWVFGSDGFAWQTPDNSGQLVQVRFTDWNNFTGNFHSAGIDLATDCTRADDARVSQNIVNQYQERIGDGTEFSPLWKRIDFGYHSIRVDFERLSRFLADNRQDLVNFLRSERYLMLQLAVQYLTEREKMRDSDIGRLEVLIGDYRCASLNHYAMGFGPTISRVDFDLNNLTRQSLL